MQEKLLEAERRIAEARRTRAESLDLGDLALSELPASLRDLPHLKMLSLGAYKLTQAGELAYDSRRPSSTFTDLQPLAELQAVQSLDLSWCRGVTDLQPLAGLQSLRSLDLSITGVTDLHALAGLQSLQSLDLYGCRPAVPARLVRAFADHPRLTNLVAGEAAGVPREVLSQQSQCDRIADRRPPPARLDGPNFFEAFYSAKSKEELGRDTLEAHLRDAMRYLLDRHGELEIGRGRAEVRRRLYDWRTKDQQKKPEQRRHRTLTLEEFRALCGKVKGIASWEHALDYFHHTGVVFYRPDLFANRILLDQDWALDAIYTVFHRGRAAPWLRDSGRFTREDLALLAWQEHSPEEQRLFLGLMESCGVCFRCGKTAQGEPRYVAPDLLPAFQAVKGRLHAWKEEPGTPTLRLEYRFFHQAVIRGLMKRVGERAGDLAEYWKYGFWFKDGQRDTQILVRFEDTSTAESPGAGALVLKALGPHALSLLREIRRITSWQRIGEEPEELLTLDGTTVARSALAAAAGLPGKSAHSEAFAAFFEDREHDPAGIDITPRRLTASEKPREVFLSYAWGDDTPEGKVRAQVVDELQSAFEKDGFKPVRDRDRIRPGELISAFIRQLTRADYVVAVISKKYLRSPYCMYEIYRLWQRCQGDADNLARQVVPIVLPEVKVGNALQRASYVRHWKREEKKLEKLHRDLGLSLSAASVQEARLVREFAHHVDEILCFLNDVLMPRKLEVHLDDGFQAVREALRRRMAGESAGKPSGPIQSP